MIQNRNQGLHLPTTPHGRWHHPLYKERTDTSMQWKTPLCSLSPTPLCFDILETEITTNGGSVVSSPPPWAMRLPLRLCRGWSWPVRPLFNWPRMTALQISPCLFLMESAFHHFPKVLAADVSGLILLQAEQGAATGPISPAFWWRPWGEVSRICSSVILDTKTATAYAMHPQPRVHP